VGEYRTRLRQIHAQCVEMMRERPVLTSAKTPLEKYFFIAAGGI
jgi:hypothetical protein